MNKNIKNAYFAGGCFWGVEYYFQNLPGVVSTKVGFMGGYTENPTYDSVCSYSTGHAETVHITYDQKIVTYENLAKLFFEIHDPTQKNRQGPDIGEQYRSAIFFTDEDQEDIAEKLVLQLESNGLNIVTKVKPADTFWVADDNHQRYYAKNGQMPYCHTRVKRF